eukprot:gene12264-25775_t
MTLSILLILFFLSFQRIYGLRSLKLPFRQRYQFNCVTPKLSLDMISFEKNMKYSFKCLSCISIAFSLCLPAYAQIPTMDAYTFGTGSVRQLKGSSTKKMGALNIENINSRDLVQEISNIKEYVTQYNWDDVRSIIKDYKIIRTKLFGAKTLNELQELFHISKDQANALEDSRENLSFVLGQLDDIAISNRVVFFNSEDLKQIALIGENEDLEIENAKPKSLSKVSLEEPLGYINDAIEFANNIKSIIKY